jgi:hypothetical protein
MQKLSRDDLLSLELYAEERGAFRTRVIAHKRDRQVALGAHVTIRFEDRLTIQYQVQEMLRAEKIFDRAGIEVELAAYNPLIPDGTNLKATMMIEYDDPDERRVALAELRGIEDRIWMEVADGERIWAVADEDLERSTEEKTSAVHFLRFELARSQVEAVRQGAAISFGVDHDAYRERVVPVGDAVRASLAADLAE